jgi:hypothetical protein
LKCPKCNSSEYFSFSFDEEDIKSGPFVIEGSCEKCGRTYAVVMQLFDKSKLEDGRLDIDISIIQSCSKCPAFSLSWMEPKKVGRHSEMRSGTNRCDMIPDGRKVVDPTKIPKWCPLPRLMP